MSYEDVRRCPHCGRTRDPWKWTTEELNSAVRTLIDATGSHMVENPGVPPQLIEAWVSLQDAAVHFTNTLYRKEGQ